MVVVPVGGRALLFETAPTDSAILGSVVVLLAALSCVASYLPARRVDPLVALRSE